MSSPLRIAAIVVAAIVVVAAAAQLVRPDHSSPAINASRTIQGHPGTTKELVAVLDRACGDCHSYGTTWPWYTEIVPLSWVWAYTVNEGRNAVNFSEWAGYTSDRQRTLLTASCRDATSGKMPVDAYTILRPEARLSASDVETICAAARLAGAVATSGL